jgi:sortase A
MGRRAVRRLGTALVVVGVLVFAWTFVVWRWEDPFTALYTHYEQHRLSGQYKKLAKSFHAPPIKKGVPIAVEERQVALEAGRFRKSVHTGEAIGRILVPRLHLAMVLVNGTDTDSLKRGPGRDLATYMPGQGQLVYIAGHRTTYLAPFSHIDSLRPGDIVTLQVPYGTFVYKVRMHKIVDASDIAVLRSHNREVVILQACHPRFFATHRYLVYAYPVRVYPTNGRGFAVGS